MKSPSYVLWRGYIRIKCQLNKQQYCLGDSLKMIQLCALAEKLALAMLIVFKHIHYS